MKTLIAPPRKVILELGTETPFQISEYIEIHELRMLISFSISMLNKKVNIKAYGEGVSGPSMNFGTITLSQMHNQSVELDVHLTNTWKVDRITVEPEQGDNFPIFIAIESIG